MCVCVYYVCIYICMFLRLFVCVCMYVCLFVCRYVCMFVCQLYICIYICLVFVCMHVFMYICMNYVRGVLISPQPDQEGTIYSDQTRDLFNTLLTNHNSLLSQLLYLLQATKNFRRFSVQPILGGSNDLRVGRKMEIFQLFFQCREQVVFRRGQIRKIGWVIKTMEAQVVQFLLGCKCLVSRGNVV